MKLVGVSNPLGYNPIKDKLHYGPISLYTIYQDDKGTYYTKYIDVGGFPFLVQMCKELKDDTKRAMELDCYLNQKRSIGAEFPYKYRPIPNEWIYNPFPTEYAEEMLASYAALNEFENASVEAQSGNPTEDNRRAVIFPNKELYVGARGFIYQNAAHNLSVEGKSVEEIKGIIRWLVQNMFLEEAYSLIESIKASGKSLEEYKHPKNLIVSDGSDNFLDEKLNDIEALQFVRERTKPIHLRIFD